MKTYTIDEIWENQFGKFYPPEAHLLKYDFSELWIRFHSLPDSKRYPETESDKLIIIQRHNEILNALNKFNDKLYLIRSVWTDHIDTKPKSHGLGMHWRSWVRDSDGLEYIIGHAYYDIIEWKTGVFNDLILNVSDDEESNLMVINSRNFNLYHPYDGGCDIILKRNHNKTEAKIIEFKTIFSEYLSKHPHGL
jgi:hypothetical protein